MTKSKSYIYLMALLAVTFWGISYVWTKIAFEYYSPITVMLIRLGVSSLLLAIIARFMGKRQRIQRTDYRDFVILAFFSPFCYFLGENYGVFYVSPTVAAVIIATIPVFSPILAYLAFKERIRPLNVAGFMISFAGVMVMVLDAEMKFTADPKGILWLFFAVASALVNIVFLKKLAARYSSFTIIRVQNTLGALFFLPLFLIMDVGSFVRTTPSAETIFSLLALAVFGSTLAFMFYTSAVRVIGIARTAVFANLIPVVTAIAALLVLKESIDPGRILGMLIVIAGLFMSQASKIRQRRKASKK